MRNGRTTPITCWVCGENQLQPKQVGVDCTLIGPENFKITDSSYGEILPLFKCSNCGFLQCYANFNIDEMYEEMNDEAYVQSERERTLQQSKILKKILKFSPTGSLLDVGAGTGLLVEQAEGFGYECEGLEPSKFLHQRAIEKNRQVKLGYFPRDASKNNYSVITLIDVIEHVKEPVELLRQARDFLAEDGVCVIITPNVNSLVARILGPKWWHFRIAHIGYFSNHTLKLALERAGLKVIDISRPGWYFRFGYLRERLNKYFPNFFQIPSLGFMDKIVVPLNLFDSLMYIVKRK